MAIPSITTLQGLTIQLISKTEIRGRELRELLEKNGAKMSSPAFYQMMARLEENGFIGGRYVTKRLEGNTIKERWYKAHVKGQRALEGLQAFCRQHFGEVVLSAAG